MTYSLYFRKKIRQIQRQERLTFDEASKRFDISIRSLFCWDEKLAPCTTRNKPATKIEMNDLALDVKRHPDDYQWERAKRFKVSQSAIQYALIRLDMSNKKTLQHPKADERARIRFQEKINAYEKSGQTIVYLDESGFSLDIPRTHG